MSSNGLPPQLARLHTMLDNRGCIPIVKIYRLLLHKPAPSRRYAQQVLGKYVTRYNRAGMPGKIVPGHIKGTLQIRPR